MGHHELEREKEDGATGEKQWSHTYTVRAGAVNTLEGSWIWGISKELLTKGTTTARCCETSQELMMQGVENTEPDHPYLGISRKSEQGLPESHEKIDQCEPETAPQFTSNCFHSQLNKDGFAIFLSFLFTMFWDRS